MTIIAPSILACDFLNIESEINTFKTINNIWLHLDIMDGHFVPNLSFGQQIIQQISEKTAIPLDAHFMVTNPEFYVESLKKCKIHNFTFHSEACKDSIKLIKKGKKYFKSMGISIKPNTSLSSLSIELLREIDLLLIMSVEPGFGGQSFIEKTYEKLSVVMKLKKTHNFKFDIQVDGGITNENSMSLINHGASNLVAGSYIFKAEQKNYKEKIESLRN